MNNPYFYLMDLDNYNEDFLKEIILWQNERIRELKSRDFCGETKTLDEGSDLE